MPLVRGRLPSGVLVVAALTLAACGAAPATPPRETSTQYWLRKGFDISAYAMTTNSGSHVRGLEIDVVAPGTRSAGQSVSTCRWTATKQGETYVVTSPCSGYQPTSITYTFRDGRMYQKETWTGAATTYEFHLVSRAQWVKLLRHQGVDSKGTNED